MSMRRVALATSLLGTGCASGPGPFDELMIVEHGDVEHALELEWGEEEVPELVVADVDGDGMLDVSAADHSHAVMGLVFEGFSALFLFPGPGFTSCIGPYGLGDINGDGHVDAYCVDQTVDVYLGDGEAHFAAREPVAVEEPWTATIGDVTGDGVADLLAFGIETVIEDGASGEVTSLAELPDGSPAAVDVDGDGVAELLNAKVGGFTIQSVTPDALVTVGDYGSDVLGASPLTPAVGDADGDGVLDLLDRSTACFVRGEGGAVFGERVCAPEATQDTTAWGDFDGDGHLDVTTIVDGDRMTWMGSPEGAFGSPTVTENWAPLRHADSFHGFQAADMDGDGDAELVFTRYRDDPNCNEGC